LGRSIGVRCLIPVINRRSLYCRRDRGPLCAPIDQMCADTAVKQRWDSIMGTFPLLTLSTVNTLLLSQKSVSEDCRLLVLNQVSAESGILFADLQCLIVCLFVPTVQGINERHVHISSDPAWVHITTAGEQYFASANIGVKGAAIAAFLAMKDARPTPVWRNTWFRASAT